jgi:nucleotide-binding universal stress UspA family protein
MYPFRNILFPTDFSHSSHAALKYAVAFARSGSGRVVMVNVQATKVPSNLLTLHADSVAEDWLQQLRTDAKSLLSNPAFKKVDVDVAFVDGEAPTAIAQAAVDHEIDLMTVVMRGGRKRFARAFGGSIAEEIVAESPCAVLAIRPPQRDFAEPRDGKWEISLKRILLATNFRPSSAAATQLATHIANHMSAELNAVYVIGDYFEQISSLFPEGGLAALTRLRSHVEERMDHLARTDGSRAQTHVVEGRPYEEIVRLAVKSEADLIVIGTAVHNALFGGTPVLGSEIERVIRNSPCPVLCVPAARVVTQLPAFVTQAVPN